MTRVYSVGPNEGTAGVVETSDAPAKQIALTISGVEQRAGPPGAPLILPTLAEIFDAIDVLKRHLLSKAK